MANYHWLYQQLRGKGLTISSQGSGLLCVSKLGKTYMIYCPDSDEYLITCDIVQKVADMGGNTISYATTWCHVASEAVAYGKKIGVQVIPNAALFKILG